MTYFNSCRCKESRVDIGYDGPCRGNSFNGAEPLKWGNFSQKYLGWGFNGYNN